MSDSSSFYRRQQSANPNAHPRQQSQFEIPVVGVTFNNRQSTVARLRVGERVLLRRDPTNPHDRNAISVETTTGNDIGFVGRDLAQRLAPTFDRYGKLVEAIVTALVGGELRGSSLGVRIRFTVPEPLPVDLPDIEDEL